MFVTVIHLNQLTKYSLTVEYLTEEKSYKINVTATNSIGKSCQIQSNFPVKCMYVIISASV